MLENENYSHYFWKKNCTDNLASKILEVTKKEDSKDKKGHLD